MKTCVCSACSIGVFSRFLAILSAIILFLSSIATAGTLTEYRYDAAGNIAAIERSGTALNLSSFYPTSGPVGTEITIYGGGFNPTPLQNTVAFNGVAATVLQAATKTLTAQVPAGAMTGPIQISANGEEVLSMYPFTVTVDDGEPIIEYFSLRCGKPGTLVSVEGAGFVAGATMAGTGNIMTSAQVINPRKLQFIIPSGATSGYLRVTTPQGTAVGRHYFLVPPGAGQCTEFTAGVIPFIAGQTETIALSPKRAMAITFEGSSDELWTLLFSSVALEPSYAYVDYQLLHPDGNILKSGLLRGDEITFHIPPLSQEGTHLLILRATAEATGSFGLSLLKDPILMADADKVHIKTTRLGQTARVGFMATAGQSLGIGLLNLSTSWTWPHAYLHILSFLPNGERNSGSGNYANCYLAPGRCDLSVNQTIVPGVYTILLTPPQGETFAVDALLSNNIQTVLQRGQSLSLALDRPGQDGWLGIEGQAGENISLTLSDIVRQPDIGVLMEIYTPTGGYLKGVRADPGRLTTLELDVTGLPTTGTYRVWITPYLAGVMTGTLHLQ